MKIDLEHLKTITVLYVEDDTKVMDGMVQIFDKMLNKVYTANNGEEGFNLFQQYQNEIDIVVTDINMPIKNGLDMIKDILEIKSMPIIVTTAYTNTKFLMNSIDLGIDKYMPKPVKIQKLIREIDKLVKKNRKNKHIQKATEKLVIKNQKTNQEMQELKSQVNDTARELQLLRALTNNYISIIYTNRQAIITDVSTKFCNLYGYSKDEIIGEKIMKIQNESTSGNEIQKYMLEAIHQKKAVNTIHDFKTKNGKILECNMIMTPHFGDDGYVNGYTFYQDLIHV